MPYSQGMTLEAGHEIVVSNFEQLQERFYEVKYQALYWDRCIRPGSIDTSVAEGAQIVSYGVSDWTGVGGFISGAGTDVPTVSLAYDKVPIPLYLGGVGGFYTLEDMRAHRFAWGTPLDTSLMSVMKKASDKHIEGAFFYGAPELSNFPGYIDNPNVTVANVINGAGGNPEWSTKTQDEILFDVNDAIRSVWENSKFNHIPNVVEIPAEQYSIISTTRVADAVDNYIIDLLIKNNLYTRQTGQPLTIRMNPHLDGAGVGGTDRMIVKEENEENEVMPFPILHRLLMPQLVGYATKLLSEHKFGPYHLRYPGSQEYRDGI